MIHNDLESIKIETNATVSSLSCQRPELNILNRAEDFFNPTIIPRSKYFSLVGQIILQCDHTLSNTKQWFLNKINPSTGKMNAKVSLANIASALNAEIFIPSNFLDYGTYEFVYQVNMNDDAGPFVETINTFVKIVPTGMAIFPFSGGIKQITIGIAQSIELDPGRYSYDFDGIFNGTQLSYRFFCRIMVNGLPLDFPSDSHNSYLDLRQLKDNAFEMNTTKTCFNDKGTKPTVFFFFLKIFSLCF